MYSINQITPMNLYSNKEDLESFLSYQLTPLITEKSWLKEWIYIAQRFKLLKFKEMNHEEILSYEWNHEKVEEIVESTIVEVQKVLPFDNVTITIIPAMPFRWFQKYDRGIWTNGFTNGPNCIQLAVPPKPDEQFLRHMIAHELHHATPINPIYNLVAFTLGDWLKMEGTAEFFSLNLYEDKRWWKTNFTSEIEQLYWSKVQNKIQTTDDDDMNLLCFGNPKKDIPYLAGYAFAYEMVKNYVNKNPIDDIKELYSIKPMDFIKAYNEGKRPSTAQ